MPRTPKPQPTCRFCPAPATETVGVGEVPVCGRCAPVARDIAAQQAQVLIQAIRKLKAEHKERTAA